MQLMNISKLQAAQRQMDCAIGLYFAERDEVSIHTLVGAAYLVLSDLSKAAKKDSPVDQYVKPEHREKFEGAIRASQNFFKHADRGSEAALLDFNPHETELLLFINVETFRQLSGGITDSMSVFLTYSAATWGEAAFEAVPGNVLAEIAEIAADTPKPDFFALCMKGIAQRAAG